MSFVSGLLFFVGWGMGQCVMAMLRGDCIKTMVAETMAGGNCSPTFWSGTANVISFFTQHFLNAKLELLTVKSNFWDIGTSVMLQCLTLPEELIYWVFPK